MESGPNESQHFPTIGQPIRRKEDLRLVTGLGRFSDDFNLEGQVFAAFVRSPYPHARIVAINTDAARAMSGVLGVFSGEDCRRAGLRPIDHSPVPSTSYDMKLTAPGGGRIFAGRHMLLPTDKVRHVGEAVVMVLAQNANRAQDAAEAVQITYDELAPVTDSEAALTPNAAAIWGDLPNNVLVDTVFGDAAATAKAFASADHVVKVEFDIGRVTAVPMEPRAALASYDPATDRYTLYAGSGGAVRQKHELAAVLGVAPERLRVLSYDVGGNFGSRNRVYVEFGLVLWAARMSGRPVKYTASRSEAFLTDYQGRDLKTKVELALRADWAPSPRRCRWTCAHRTRSGCA